MDNTVVTFLPRIARRLCDEHVEQISNGPTRKIEDYRGLLAKIYNCLESNGDLRLLRDFVKYAVNRILLYVARRNLFAGGCPD